MADFDGFKQAVQAGLGDLVGDTIGDYADSAMSRANDFLDDAQEDLATVNYPRMISNFWSRGRRNWDRSMRCLKSALQRSQSISSVPDLSAYCRTRRWVFCPSLQVAV